MEIWVWGIIFAACLIVEGATAGLVSIWFAAGAAAAGVISLIWPDALWLQVSVFIVVSGVTLVATRPYARRLRDNRLPTNADRNIGAEAVVTQAISAHEPGAVKVNGMIWTAISENGLPVSEGEIVIVKSISGAKVTVAPK